MRTLAQFTLASVAVPMLCVAACSDSSGTMMQPQEMIPPAAGATAGMSAAGASGTGSAGQGVAGMRATATAGAAAVGGAGSSAMSMAGRAADTDDAGVEPVDASMPMAGTGATTAGTGATQPPMMRADLGKGDGSDVITIGDSWMNLGTTGIQQSLLKASGQRYRTYGRGGTRLLDDVIPNQYETAKRADPDIKTVVMTGGGNDIIQVPGLRDDCTAMGMRCQMVMQQIADRLTKLWDEMSADGVQDVVYVQYANPEGQNVDFALANGDGVKKRCESVKPPMRCHRLETLDIVMGDIPDGIHPSGAAFDRLGQAVFKLMTDQGMRR
jgi:lysophospholipase L1-like esterase